jgi:hypothetical protein
LKSSSLTLFLAAHSTKWSANFLHHGPKEGNRVGQLVTDKRDIVSSQFFVSAGFALSRVHCSTALQSDSTFRYLGDEGVGNILAYLFLLSRFCEIHQNS